MPARTVSPTAARSTAVVLVHGYMCLAPGLYWRGLRPLQWALLGRAVAVVVAHQPRAASVERRARHLAAFLGELPYPRLTLVGHSMGGLDARWMASRLDPAQRVRRVLTIGTPHRGSALATVALRSPCWRARTARLLDRGALRDLTPEGADRLNRLMPDREDVAYLSLAGALAPDALPPLLRLFGLRLAEEEGENDGLVGVASATWGRSRPTLAADHLGLIGAVVGPPWGGHRLRARDALGALREALVATVG